MFSSKNKIKYYYVWTMRNNIKQWTSIVSSNWLDEREDLYHGLLYKRRATRGEIKDYMILSYYNDVNNNLIKEVMYSYEYISSRY